MEKFNDVIKYVFKYSGEEKEIIRPTVMDIQIQSKDCEILHFVSNWGDEFNPRNIPLINEYKISAVMGRSCRESNNNIYLICDTEVYFIHIAYSGNYDVYFQKNEGKINVSVMYDENFTTCKQLNEEFISFPIYMVSGKNKNDCAIKMHEFVRSVIYKGNNFTPPIAWNHWWTYEDITINEEIFYENAKIAVQTGFDTVVLDAGWFGKESIFWEEIRGDWEFVNTERFPNGLKVLSEKVKALGLKFGLWIELEGLGSQSSIYENNEKLVARRDGESLNYICLGSKYAQEWGKNQLERIIIEYDLDYIKYDFNLDPMEGCNDVTHDHGKNDGLDAHYKGLYNILKYIKTKYPNVILENCSSGGLRCDLSLLENMDLCFMSDPDYTEHSHQCYQGFSSFLPPERIYHFSWSHAIDKGRYAIPQCDFSNGNITQENKKYFIRSVSMHAFGVSHPLVEMTKRDLDLLSSEINIHKNNIEIIKNGQLYSPSKQTIKNFQGNRNPFYVVTHENSILIYGFCLEMGLPEINIDLSNYLNFDVIKQIDAVDADYAIEGKVIKLFTCQQSACIVKLIVG